MLAFAAAVVRAEADAKIRDFAFVVMIRRRCRSRSIRSA